MSKCKPKIKFPVGWNPALHAQLDQPPGIPTPRLRGRQGMGLTYERKVGRLLRAHFRHVWCGVWIRDVSGRWHQPDHVIWDRVGVPIIVECKLSQDDERAFTQLNRYARVLGQASCIGVQATQWPGKAWGLTISGRNASVLGQLPQGSMALWHVIP